METKAGSRDACGQLSQKPRQEMLLAWMRTRMAATKESSLIQDIRISEGKCIHFADGLNVGDEGKTVVQDDA